MNHRRRPRIGFSLLELIVVLLIMSLLATAATLSIRGAVVRQRLTRAAEIVEQFDTALRRLARQQRQPISGSIERRRGRFSIAAPGSQSLSYTLPKQVSIDSIRYRSGAPRAAVHQVTAGPDGQSPTYAMQLSCGDSQRWVLLVGGSGQVIHGLDSQSIRSMLEVR